MWEVLNLGTARQEVNELEIVKVPCDTLSGAHTRTELFFCQSIKMAYFGFGLDFVFVQRVGLGVW